MSGPKPKRPIATGGVIVSDFKEGDEAIRELQLPMLLEPVFNVTDPKVNGALRLFAEYLVNNPDLIPPSPWKPVTLEIFRQFCADHPRRKRAMADVARLVDWKLLSRLSRTDPKSRFVDDEKLLASSRRDVARALGMNYATVKKHHQKYGWYKGRASP